NEEGARASAETGGIKPTCRELPEGDCTPVRAVKVRPLRAVNERPLIAAVPIGHRDDPTVLPAPPPAVIPSPAVSSEEPRATAALMETAVAEATAANKAPAAEPTPPAPTSTATAKRPRARAHHAQEEARPRRRAHDSYASSYSARSSYRVSNTYLQGGY